MKKILSLIAAATFILSACDNNKKEAAAEEKPTVKIGAVLPLSGDSAFAGIATRAGLEMILDREKAKGLKYNYKFIFEDNAGESMRAATSTNKLIYSDKVNALLSIWHPLSGIMAHIANNNKIVSMSCSWADEALIGDYSFNAISTHEDTVELLIQELKKRNIRKVATLMDPSGEPSLKVMKEKFPQAGIKLVYSEVVNYGQRDYKMEITKANARNPEMYIIGGFSPLHFIFTKQLGEITGKKNVTGIDAFSDMSEKERVLVEGLWYIDSNVNGNEQFAEDMLKEKGTPTESCAGNTAANLQILIKAFENAPLKAGETVPSSESVVEYIKNNIVNFDTVSGRVTVSEDGLIDIKPHVRMVKDGKTVEIEE